MTLARFAPLALLTVLALSSAAASAQEPRAIAISLQDGKASGPELTQPARGAPVLRLIQGEPARLRFTADRDTALHLHGYKIETRATPDAPAEMRFIARAAGRFPLETHLANGRHATLLYIEVHPR